GADATHSATSPHTPPSRTELSTVVGAVPTDRGPTPHGLLDGGGDSASPKFADDGGTNSGKLPHDPAALTALANDASGDDSAQPGKTNQGHHASADPDINDVANNHPSHPPDDRTPETPAPPVAYPSRTVTH